MQSRLALPIPKLAVIHLRSANSIVKTTHLASERITIELTEFEMTALAALVERGQIGVSPEQGGELDIHRAIHRVSNEFRSLLGHFELADWAAND